MAPDRPSRSGRIELTVGLLALAGIVTAGAALAARRNTPVPAGLAVDSTELDFGPAWEQPAFRHTFTVTNPTDRPIRVADITTSCGCTTVTPQSFTVPPGGQQEVTAALDLTGRSSAAERFAVELRPLLSHQPPGGRTVWTLRGDVRPNPIRLSETAIDFGDEVILGESPPSREVEIELGEGVPPGELRATCDGGGAVELQPTGDRRWRLTVTPPVPEAVGPFEFMARLEVAGAKPPLSRDIPVSGAARGDIAAWPPAVNFGVLEVGDTGTEYVTLASHAGRPFEVLRIAAPAGAEITPATEQSVDGKTYIIRQRADERGNRPSTATFSVRPLDSQAGEPAETEIPLMLSYFGTAGGRDPSASPPAASAGGGLSPR